MYVDDSRYDGTKKRSSPSSDMSSASWLPKKSKTLEYGGRVLLGRHMEAEPSLAARSSMVGVARPEQTRKAVGSMVRLPC